ncbi:MAG: AbrB family transcriptional regulator [Candidatus Caldatribacteriota bacterium]
MILSLFLIFIFGYLGYRIFSFLRIPGGATTGSLLMLAIISSQGFEWVAMPSYLSSFFQVVIGAMIGSRLNKEQIPTIKSLLVPGLLSSAWMIFISLVVGFLLAKMTGMDLGSALYGSVPAGLFEMGLIALSLNLSVPIVTLLQFFRVISINLSVPFIVSHYKNWDKTEFNCQIKADNELTNNTNNTTKNTNNNTNNNANKDINDSNNLGNGNNEKKERANVFGILLSLLLGSIGGFTAKYLGIPVGCMLGSMVVVGTLRILGAPLQEIPKWLILVTQIMIGGSLGATFSPEMVAYLKSLLLPVLLFSAFVVVNGIFIGFWFYRILKWDLATALLATAAGGVTLMTLVAIDINADPVRVSILQTLRIIIILIIMPTLIMRIIY